MSKGTVNRVTIIGRLGSDVAMSYFDGGGCIGRVGVATNDSYTNKQTGELVETTEWHTLVVRNKSAEVFSKYLSKGSKVYVEGKLNTRKWKDNEGVERYTTEVNVLSFTFLDPKDETPSSNQSAVEAYNNKSNESHAGDQFLKGQTDKPKEDPEDELPY